ncbi:Nucleoside triphosphate pyrophosphohydrolase MazG [Klebsiella michiganensis]|uniref:Nucleoside triphosphate pyrophosphohydrolase MazG n=1 Tax=Klebsiella michiganensis TaxID=1134687 RepID=A0A7H4PJ07_9ENTR|nr:Nucleoside triphosphate pyrophosphohydrolase MazG [Klebsiella michiganensis]
MTQIERLLGIMRRLRDPENGCPWDKEPDLCHHRAVYP